MCAVAIATESSLTKLLKERHTNDIFIPQCKTGPSWTSCYGIMDAWVMKPSWAHPLIIGYEIKCSREDFMADEKWQSYLKFCNEFYFVCPSKMIQPEELPEGVGLLWAASTLTRLFRKKKAVYRDIQIPDQIFRYILMSRAKIDSTNTISLDSANFWKNWIENKELNHNLGWRVSKALRELISKKIHEVETKNHRLEMENKRLLEIKTMCEEMGVNVHWYMGGIRKQLENMTSLVGKETENIIRNLHARTEEMVAVLDAAKKGNEKDGS